MEDISKCSIGLVLNIPGICELKNECKARLHTDAINNEVILLQLHQHSHGSDVAQLQAASIMTKIKKQSYYIY